MRTIKIAPKNLGNPFSLPQRGTEDSAGYDLIAREVEIDTTHKILTVKYNVKLEIPKGFFGLLVPRSSIYKRGLIQANGVGIIDSDYRGELMQKFKFETNFFGSIKSDLYGVGERSGQLLILPYEAINYVTGDVDDTSRGEGGFGSTDKEFSKPYDIEPETMEDVEDGPDAQDVLESLAETMAIEDHMRESGNFEVIGEIEDGGVRTPSGDLMSLDEVRERYFPKTEADESMDTSNESDSDSSSDIDED